MKAIAFFIEIINSLWGIISSLYKYRDIYKITGLFATRKFSQAKNFHRYAVLIAARNEEAVIGKLIESIAAQDYPSERITVFVVADNCTDNTAEISRTLGAVCYERFDDTHRTKGFALKYLVDCIHRDYGKNAFEGYFIFDADNLLKKDFISRMNDAFDAGEKIITSYRATKNFDQNWISASYAIHWLRTIRNEHRARSLFRLATRIQGTGFLFAGEVIEDGWNYTGLTEDRAFCADAVARGYKISYNHEAQFYDEQPVNIKIAMRQRIRWSKGHLQALRETGPTLLRHIFYTGDQKDKNFISNIRLRFMSFDMLTVVFPRSLFSLIKRWLVCILRICLVLGEAFIVTDVLAPPFVRKILTKLSADISPNNNLSSIVWLLIFTVCWALSGYFNGTVTAAYIYIIERRRIKPIRWYKKIWFCLTFPLFDQIGKLTMLIALFSKVEWKPIPHNAAIGIEELEKFKNRE